jgi:hypothetical protein
LSVYNHLVVAKPGIVIRTDGVLNLLLMESSQAHRGLAGAQKSIVDLRDKRSGLPIKCFFLLFDLFLRPWFSLLNDRFEVVRVGNCPISFIFSVMRSAPDDA